MPVPIRHSRRFPVTYNAGPFLKLSLVSCLGFWNTQPHSRHRGHTRPGCCCPVPIYSGKVPSVWETTPPNSISGGTPDTNPLEMALITMVPPSLPANFPVPPV
jgi:hypothetical protein